MNEILEIKVTRIKNRWHARLKHIDGRVIDEMACEVKEDISFICSEMLRWADKLGWASPMAHAARTRMNKKYRAREGKVWYRTQLEKARE